MTGSQFSSIFSKGNLPKVFKVSSAFCWKMDLFRLPNLGIISICEISDQHLSFWRAPKMHHFVYNILLSPLWHLVNIFFDKRSPDPFFTLQTLRKRGKSAIRDGYTNVLFSLPAALQPSAAKCSFFVSWKTCQKFSSDKQLFVDPRV